MLNTSTVKYSKHYLKFSVIMCSPVQKRPKKDIQVKHTRVERMRRLYMQCRAPGDFGPVDQSVCSCRDPISPQFLCVPH